MPRAYAGFARWCVISGRGLVTVRVARRRNWAGARAAYLFGLTSLRLGAVRLRI
jgi:hypothetical protein